MAPVLRQRLALWGLERPATARPLPSAL